MELFTWLSVVVFLKVGCDQFSCYLGDKYIGAILIILAFGLAIIELTK